MSESHERQRRLRAKKSVIGPHKYDLSDVRQAIALTLEGMDDLGRTVRFTGIEANAAGKLGAARSHLEAAIRYLDKQLQASDDALMDCYQYGKVK